jgi:DNA-directed RNA polymerase subunit L
MYEGPGVALRLTSIDTNDPYLLVHDSQVVTIVEQTPVSQDATVGQQFSINVTNTGTIPWIVRAGLFESASKRALPFDDQMWIATLLPGSYLRLDAIVTMGLGDDPSTAAYKVAHVAYDELESDAQYRITVSGRRLRARATMTRSMRWLREMFARYTFEEFERVRVVVDDGFSQFNIEEKYTVGSTLERYAYDLDNTVGLVVYKIPNQLERKGVMNVKHADPSRLLAAAAAQIVGDCDIVIGNLED